MSALDDCTIFAGLLVRDFATSTAWYERLLGTPPTFLAHAKEAVWELAPHRSIYIEEEPEHAGHSEVTVFLSGDADSDRLEEFVAAASGRGVEPVKRETYDNGVRKITYNDPDGNEIGLGGVPLVAD